MKIEGSIITEQGQTFAIIVVKPHVINNALDAQRIRQSVSAIQDFNGIPIILAAQDARGQFTYQGRRDIVGFLASIDPSRIPWKQYYIS
jgi:aromatic ring-opening dioxygenase catalytic subunit (LigB family)